jgi:23S rRNA (pseudouridine1915-N3)-methyltransferase
MKINLIAVGRLREGADRHLFEAYIARLHEPPTLIEVEEKRKLDPVRQVTREGELLLARVPPGAHVIALDGAGTMLSSAQFAQKLTSLRESGTPALAILIGGADGLAKAVVDRADFVLSLGALTWPHMLVRTMLAEQLYRAEAIARGHPYHRAGPPPGR